MPKYAANPEPVQRIKTLADLIAYLRDELGWPISPDSVSDDLTFDWSADELRLAAKRSDGAADTAGLEREIDERVYRLYGLTAEEIKIVEEARK